MIVARLFRHNTIHQEPRGLEIEHEHLRLKQRGLHPLAFTRCRTLHQGNQNTLCGKKTRTQIRDGNAHAHGPLTRLARDGHKPTHTLRNLIKTWPSS